MMQTTSTIRWTESVSDGTARCMSDDCEGALIPAGTLVHTRHGSQEFYPYDPTSYCAPCVTPMSADDYRVLDETDPGKPMLKLARHALAVVCANDLILEPEKTERRVANVIARELSGNSPSPAVAKAIADQCGVQWDVVTDVFTVDGVSISRALFRTLADSANEGRQFVIVKAAGSDPRGVVTLRNVPPAPPAETEVPA